MQGEMGVRGTEVCRDSSSSKICSLTTSSTSSCLVCRNRQQIGRSWEQNAPIRALSSWVGLRSVDEVEVEVEGVGVRRSWRWRCADEAEAHVGVGGGRRVVMELEVTFC